MAEGRKYSIIKAASWYTIGNILINAASFLMLPVFTRLMSVHDYGVYSTYTAQLAVLETILLCGLASTVKIAKYSELDYDTYITSILSIPFFLTILTGIIVNVILCFYPIFWGMNKTLWNFMLLTVFFLSVNSILSGRLVIDGKYKVFMGYSIICTVGGIVFSLILCFTVYRNHEIYMSRVIGMCVATILATIFLLFYWGLGNLKLKYIVQGVRWGIPLLFHGIAASLMAQSDRILIQKYDSFSSAGIYNIAVTMATIPMVIVTSFENAWVPWFYDKLSKKRYDVIAKMNNLYISFFAVIIALFILVSPEVIKIFTHPDYWDSIYSLAPLAVSIFAELLYLIPLNMELYYKKTKKIAFMTIFVMLFNVVFDIICIVNINYIAAAFVTFIARYILFLLHWIYKNKLDCNRIVDPWVVLVSSIILIALSMGMQFIGDLFLVRWIMAFLLFVAIMVYAKKRAGFFKEILGMKRKIPSA